MKKCKSIVILLIIVFSIKMPQTISALGIYEDNIITLEEAEKISKAGTYFIKLSLETEDGTFIDEIKKIHITKELTVLNYQTNVGIDAHEIIINNIDNINFDDANELINLAKAHAWNLETGVPINHLNVDVIKENKRNRIIFSTNDGTSIQVSVLKENEREEEVDEKSERISIVTDSFRTLSLAAMVLIVIPIIIYILLNNYVNRRKREVNKLLNR